MLGSAIALRAAVADSASASFAGSGLETGLTATIGDITRMRVAFDVYQAGSCLSGTPVTTLTVGVIDTAPAGDGLGSATATWSGASEGSYCVVPRLVGSSPTIANAYYVAPAALPGGLAVYRDATSGMVTGGGWTLPATGRLNFGMNAKTSNGGVKGQLVTAVRSSLNGRRTMIVIKSNALDALRVTGSTSR